MSDYDIIWNFKKFWRERERDVGLDAKYKFNFTVIITAINKKKS